MVSVSNLQYHLCWNFLVDSVASQWWWWARVAFCSTCFPSALFRILHHYDGRKQECAKFASCVFHWLKTERMWRACKGTPLSPLWPTESVSDCTAEFRSRPTQSFFLTGSLEYPDENVPCKKMNCQIHWSFLGLLWRIFCETSFNWREMYVYEREGWQAKSMLVDKASGSS